MSKRSILGTEPLRLPDKLGGRREAIKRCARIARRYCLCSFMRRMRCGIEAAHAKLSRPTSSATAVGATQRKMHDAAGGCQRLINARPQPPNRLADSLR